MPRHAHGEGLRGQPAAAAEGLEAPAFTVRVPRPDLAITVPAACSLLDALAAAGVQTRWDFRRGECGLCAMDVLA
ncbi:2Fe-2S iron-sulfur cluster binding domain-containing protein, partial [Variovorax sp. CT11-76]